MYKVGVFPVRFNTELEAGITKLFISHQFWMDRKSR